MVDDSPSDNPPPFRLEFDEGGSLFGVIEESADGEAPRSHGGMPQLREAIHACDCDQCFFPPDALSLFLKKLDKGEPGRYLLAEKRDASLTILISPDKKSVRVKTLPARGGKPLSAEIIESQLLNQGVAEPTIHKDKLAELAEATEACDAIVAEAIPAQKGEDARFIPLVEARILKERDVDADESIDMREVFDFTTVDIDQALMQRVPATAGVDGMNVVGKALPAKAGKDTQFDSKLEGARVSDDKTHLLATIQGHPKVAARSVKVDPVLSVNAVDIHTGNIDFNGTLFVKGNIESHYCLKITGDVIVGGSIFKTTLDAGGDIRVKGGIHAEGADNTHGCHIRCSGNISAKFFNQVDAECAGTLEAEEYILHSRIECHGDINVGLSKGRGFIIGGDIRGHKSINAQVLGSEAFVATALHLSTDLQAHKAVKAIEEVLDRRRGEAEQLTQILKKIRASEAPAKIGDTAFDKGEKVQATLSVLEKKIAEMEEALPALQEQCVALEELRICARKCVYANVLVQINHHNWRSESTHGPLNFQQVDDMIVATAYTAPAKKGRKD